MSEPAFGILLVALCATIEGFAQVFLKKSAMSVSRWRLWASLSVVTFVLQALVYTKALSLLDVSIAYPLGSLSFIAVIVLSKWLLQERVTRMRWVGVCFILLGVALVAARA
jgi:undecaprenyl phosphate-alpha-L-ara4N flippase subunit ArnE